jgi:oligopeptide transport system ATP-binding protein
MLLQVTNLKKYFPVFTGVFSRIKGWIHAVDGVSFDIERGETLGLVGESGCGKTTVGKTILRLLDPTDGTILFDGTSIVHLRAEELRRMRCKMQIIFQDPISSLNPRMTVGGIVGEPLRIHSIARGRALQGRVAGLLQRVGLSQAAVNRYPHEFSGGQRQRIGIARAIALEPELLVCDEPVSALDISIQAQIINLLEELQDTLGLAYLFISHDLRVVEHISDRVAVMYMGKILEEAGRDELYRNPLHPYTKVLLAAIPVLGRPSTRIGEKTTGKATSAISSHDGCSFYPRCAQRMSICSREAPRLIEISESHKVACWLHPATWGETQAGETAKR